MISPPPTPGKPPNHWVYLSPHLDDIAMSCGGLAWEQAQAGAKVEIWTICAGDPPEGKLSRFAEGIHRRWGTSPQAARDRRGEDLASCRVMGAAARHFPWPDCIYRRSPLTGKYLYTSEKSLWLPVHPDELGLVEEIAQEIASRLAPESTVVSPLGLGKHVDHRLVRLAAERLGRRLWYYADYPYVINSVEELERLRREGWRAESFAISPAGLEAWQQAVAAHATQISTFWGGLEEMREAVREYAFANKGVALWSISPAG